MKIVISTDLGMVAEHFGRCPQFTIAEINEGKVTDKKVIDNPGHETGSLPKYFRDNGIQCIIAGGAGSRAINLFQEYKIRYIGVKLQKVDDVLQAFAENRLEEETGRCVPHSGVGYGVPKKDGHEGNSGV